jgi:hypothetical protein
MPLIAKLRVPKPFCWFGIVPLKDVVLYTALLLPL